MKRTIVILLVIQILYGNVLLPELAKVPQLMEHFNEHQRENKMLNFLTFLKMHYADPEHKHNDASKHGSLPLKSLSSAHAEVIVLSEIHPSVFLVENASVFQNHVISSIENPFFDSKIRFSVFQPPRV